MRTAFWFFGSCVGCGTICTLLFVILIIFETKGSFEKVIEKTCTIENCTLRVDTCQTYCDPDDGPCGPTEYYNCTKANAIYSLTWKDDTYNLTINWGMDYCPEKVKCHFKKSKPGESLGLGPNPNSPILSLQTFLIVALIFCAVGLFGCFGVIGVAYYEYKDNRRNVIHRGKYSSDSSDV